MTFRGKTRALTLLIITKFKDTRYSNNNNNNNNNNSKVIIMLKIMFTINVRVIPLKNINLRSLEH